MRNCFVLLIASAMTFTTFLPISYGASPQPRSEVRRYTLLHDRVVNEREIKKNPRNNYVDLEVHISSGAKTFISDLQDDAKQTDKTVAIAETLSRNINTERFADIDVNFSIPLPFLALAEYSFLPSFIFENNAGTSFSISNATDGTSTEAQIYLKWDQKVGFYAPVKFRGSYYGELSLYQLTRKDLYSTKSATDIAGEDGEIADTDQLKKKEVHYTLDYVYKIKDEKKEIALIMRELRFLERKSERDSYYTKTPYFNVRYKGQTKNDYMTIFPFAGWHSRFSYPVLDGFYAGAKLLGHRIPLGIMGMMDSEFLTLIPSYEHSIINVMYTIKLPYINPRDNLWISSIHALSISFPF